MQAKYSKESESSAVQNYWGGEGQICVHMNWNQELFPTERDPLHHDHTISPL